MCGEAGIIPEAVNGPGVGWVRMAAKPPAHPRQNRAPLSHRAMHKEEDNCSEDFNCLPWDAENQSCGRRNTVWAAGLISGDCYGQPKKGAKTR